MRENLFNYYVQLGQELCYQSAFAISARRKENVYSGFLFLTSAGSIVTLSLWDKVPTLWSIIVVIAQVMQILKPLMPFAKQRDSLKYTTQDLQTLFDDVQHYWNTVGAYNVDAKQSKYISQKIRQFEYRQQEIMDRFTLDIDFPLKKRLVKKASKENKKYFKYHYNVDLEESTNESKSEEKLEGGTEKKR